MKPRIISSTLTRDISFLPF